MIVFSFDLRSSKSPLQLINLGQQQSSSNTFPNSMIMRNDDDDDDDDDRLIHSYLYSLLFVTRRVSSRIMQ